MRYVSIDIETTGIDPKKDQILSIGAIIEDTETKLEFEDLPKFHVALLHEKIIGSHFAINMNKDLIANINNYLIGDMRHREILIEDTGMEYRIPSEAVRLLHLFLIDNGIGEQIDRCITVNVAGKNFGTFDKLFLERLPNFKKNIKFRNRILDPSILFVEWEHDKTLPSLNDCKVRAGLSGEVTHNALEDAWDVIQVLRKKY
jgi:oligoribonuclease